MKLSIPIAALAVTVSMMGANVAKADTILDYTFSADAYYNFDGGQPNAVTGTFSYDVDTNEITNVDYTRGTDHFTTGAIYDTPNQVYFGPFGTDDYDVYQLQNSLALGGTDAIVGGTHPSIFISAGGSVIAAAAGAVPEPAAWALMIGGFGMAGALLRRRRILGAA